MAVGIAIGSGLQQIRINKLEAERDSLVKMSTELRILSDSIGDRLAARTNQMTSVRAINKTSQAAVLRLCDNADKIVTNAQEWKEKLLNSFNTYDSEAAKTMDAYKVWHDTFIGFLNQMNEDLKRKQIALRSKKGELQNELKMVNEGQIPSWADDIIMADPSFVTDHPPRFKSQEEKIAYARNTINKEIRDLPVRIRELEEISKQLTITRSVLETNESY